MCLPITCPKYLNPFFPFFCVFFFTITIITNLIDWASNSVFWDQLLSWPGESVTDRRTSVIIIVSKIKNSRNPFDSNVLLSSVVDRYLLYIREFLYRERSYTIGLVRDSHVILMSNAKVYVNEPITGQYFDIT
uniref:Uncharacterized protein n=1 Tax=Cacopsylla melanoneura TaxID=428564 RepID=A0A8D8X8X8_9HEMI